MGGQTASRTSKDKKSGRSEDQSLASTRHVAGSKPHTDILELQRAAGNRAVSQWVRSSNTACRGNDVPPIVRSALSSSGQPLDPATRALMESRFGHDFGQVRLHTGANAEASAAAISAKAYTVGSHIVFGKGPPLSDTARGLHTLAHELAHVVQQSRGGSTPEHDPAAPYELAAKQAAAAVSAGQTNVNVAGATGAGIARDALKQTPKAGKKTAAAPSTDATGLSAGQAISAEVTEKAGSWNFAFERPVTKEQAAAIIFQNGKVPGEAKLVQGSGNIWVVQIPNDVNAKQNTVRRFNPHTETIITASRIITDVGFPKPKTLFTWTGNQLKKSIEPRRQDLKPNLGFVVMKEYNLDAGQRPWRQLDQTIGRGYEFAFEKSMTKEEVMDKLFDKSKITKGSVRLLPMTPVMPTPLWKVEVIGEDAFSAWKSPVLRAIGVSRKTSLPTGTPAGVRAHLENKTVPKNAVRHPPDVYVWEQDGYMVYVKTDNKGKEGYYDHEFTKLPDDDEEGLRWMRQHMKDEGMPPREAWQMFWERTKVKVTVGLATASALAGGGRALAGMIKPPALRGMPRGQGRTPRQRQEQIAETSVAPQGAGDVAPAMVKSSGSQQAPSAGPPVAVTGKSPRPATTPESGSVRVGSGEPPTQPAMAPEITPPTTTAPGSRGRPRTVRPPGGRAKYHRPPPKAKGVRGGPTPGGGNIGRGGKRTAVPQKRRGGGRGTKPPAQPSGGAPIPTATPKPTGPAKPTAPPTPKAASPATAPRTRPPTAREAAIDFLAKCSKCDRGAATLDALEDIFRRTMSGKWTSLTSEPRPLPGTAAWKTQPFPKYHPVHTRGAAGELKAIRAAQHDPAVIRIRIVKSQGGLKGRRYADSLVDVRQPDGKIVTQNLEIRTSTGAKVGPRPYGGPRPYTRTAPDADKVANRIASSIRAKVFPTMKTSQLAGGGDLVITVQQGGPAPDASIAAGVNQMNPRLVGARFLREIRFVLPGRPSPRVVRYVRAPNGTFVLAP
jgi:hypothetical protein